MSSSSSLSRASAFSPLSTCSLSCTPTSTMSKPPRIKPSAHPHNEDFCSTPTHNPLTGHEPNQLDNADYSEASAVIFQDESSDIDAEPSYSCDAEFDDETGNSAIFTTVHSGARGTSEPETNLSLSSRKFVASSVPFSHTQVQGDPYCLPCFCVRRATHADFQKRKSRRDSENEQNRILLERQKEQILAEVRSETQKHFKPSLIKEVSRN